MLHNTISKLSAFLSITILLFQSGCSLFGGGSDIQRAKEYSVNPPASWSKTDRAESDRAYKTSEGNFATVTSSCNRNTDAPLEVLTRHLLIGERKPSIQNQRRIKVAGSDGLLSSVHVTEGNHNIYLALFVLSKEGCIFDFSLVSPKQITEKESSEFVNFVQSFNYGKD